MLFMGIGRVRVRGTADDVCLCAVCGMVGKGPTPGPIGRDGRAQAPSCNQRPNSTRSRHLEPSLTVGFAASCEAPDAPPESISIAVDLLRTCTRQPGWVMTIGRTKVRTPDTNEQL